jgi:hypothetical protein
MEKRKVGRPRKTSKPIVKEKKYNNWKDKYDFVAKELELAKATILEVNRSANEVIEKQADRQLDIVKLTLDSYSTMEQYCTDVVKLTGNIEESDIWYLTSVARRALLHKFVEFNESQED